MTKTKWLLYTVLIGLLPFLIRFTICIITENIPYTYIFNSIDMVAFGLVLNVSNITELDGNLTLDAESKSRNVGISVISIILFSVFLGFSYLADLPGNKTINRFALNILALVASSCSFIFSYSIFKRLS